MVKGLDVFQTWFADFRDQYILIGGTAASLAMDEAELEFRATKDLDVVLHVEALTPAYGETFWQFLKAFQRASAVEGRRVIAISDNAQYHRSRLHLTWRNDQAPGFALDFLPPYSPQLNPIERVWKLARRLCLHNRYFGFLESVAEAVEEQFADWTKPNEALRRLCAIT